MQNKINKLLKPRILRPWLEKARAAAPDLAIAVLARGKTVIYSEGFKEKAATLACLPLLLEGKEEGQAVFKALQESALQKITLCEFMANSLQELLNAELARRKISEETLDQYREVALLNRASLELNQSLKIDQTTKALLSECRQSMNPDMGMVFARNPLSETYCILDSFGSVDDLGLGRITETDLFQDIISGGKGEIINELGEDVRWKEEIPGIYSLLCVPLKSPGYWSGALVLANTLNQGAFSAAELQRISVISSVAAAALANAYHFEEVQKMLDALLQALAAAIDSRDPCTSGHSRRVAGYAVAFARIIDEDSTHFAQQSFTESDCREFFYAGLLHDVGKIGVPEEVLTKSERLPKGQLDIVFMRMALWGALTEQEWKEDFKALEKINKGNFISEEEKDLVERLANTCLQVGSVQSQLLTADEKQRLLIPRGNLMPEEWEEIKRHPADSYRILQSIPFPLELRNVLLIIRQHHEKLSGKGYPDGLQAQDIHLRSRMLAIIDIFDALTAKDRPYKKAMPREKALDILQEEAAKGDLDQDLVSIFCSNIDRIEEEVLWDEVNLQSYPR